MRELMCNHNPFGDLFSEHLRYSETEWLFNYKNTNGDYNFITAWCSIH